MESSQGLVPEFFRGQSFQFLRLPLSDVPVRQTGLQTGACSCPGKTHLSGGRKPVLSRHPRRQHVHSISSAAPDPGSRRSARPRPLLPIRAPAWDRLCPGLFECRDLRARSLPQSCSREVPVQYVRGALTNHASAGFTQGIGCLPLAAVPATSGDAPPSRIREGGAPWPTAHNRSLRHIFALKARPQSRFLPGWTLCRPPPQSLQFLSKPPLSSAGAPFP